MRIVAFTAGALLAALPLAQAGSTGSAIINSKCDFDVYVWSVDSDSTPGSPTKLSSGGTYSEKFRTPSVGGVSLKMSNSSSDTGAITQFEYTLAGFIWYDLSNVNCNGDTCPFQKYGMYLEAGSGCPTVACTGGELLCKGAYNNPDDNEDSLSCASDSDVTVYLCQSDSSGSSSSGSSGSSTSGGFIGASTAVSSSTASASTTSSSVPTPDYQQPTVASSSAASSSADVISAADFSSPSPTTLLTTAAPAAITVYTTVTAATTTTQWVYHTHGARAARHAHHPRNFRH